MTLVKRITQNPHRILTGIVLRLCIWLPDSIYLKILYYHYFKKKLDLDNPKTYNEKLQWLKLYNRNPLYTTLVDKYSVKEWVAEKIGEEHVIPTIAVYDNVDEIDFDALPDSFVLKTTHDCGGIIICKDKNKLDIEASKKLLKKAISHSYYRRMREWPYKNVKRRIIAENYMVDSNTSDLKDYKFFCFDGNVEYLFVASERQSKSETKFDFFDSSFNHLPIVNGHPNSTVPQEKPKNFEQMLSLASILSKGMPHVRVDFYEVNGQVYFGEMTFFHYSGLVPFEPEEWDMIFGSKITLP